MKRVNKIEKSIYIFGAGGNGIKAYHELKTLFNVIGFFDNDSTKWGKSFVNGIKICNPNIINESFENIFVVSNSKDIIRQLVLIGVKKYTLYPNLQLIKETWRKDEELSIRIDEASKVIMSRLSDICIEELPISDYNKKYLLTKNHRSMYLYSRILYSLMIQEGNAETFLEYGGGTGLLSILAKECGIKEVYYNDIYKISCIDSEKIAEAMGYKIAGRICGDLPDVMTFSKNTKVHFDMIASYDVLEHIYDVKLFYKNLAQVLSPSGRACMETGSNSYNQAVVMELTDAHIRNEFSDRIEVYGHKERDSLKSYFKMRIEHIKQYVESNSLKLNDSEEIALAFLTRGKIFDDVTEAVNCYIKEKKLPELDTFFEYNTCDPATGNWSEHIIDFEKLVEYLRVIKYEVELVFNGEKENSETVQVITKVFK